MAFSFNFSGDDIEEDTQMTGMENKQGRPTPKPNIEINGPMEETKEAPPEVPVKRHDLREMLNTLPSQISYTSALLISPQHERRTLIPRRALFDVRMQIMAESPASSPIALTNHDRISSTSSSSKSSLMPPNARKKKRRRDLNRNPLPSESSSDPSDPSTFLLTDSDLSSSIYEGGFKSWEGSVDLARLVLERGPRKDIDDLVRVQHVIELGCGTALPTLVLFQHALRNDMAIPFTLADYNADVLRLVTLPNLLCVWAMEVAPQALSPGLPEDLGPDGISNIDGELEVTDVLLDRFLQDLSARGMPLTLLSGPWSPALTKHLTLPLAPEVGVLMMAAETIYSPVSMVAFSELLVDVLRKVSQGKALVAAKRVYFGVGGSVDAFKEEVSKRGALCGEVQNSGIEGCDRSTEAVQIGTGGGVGRCLLEVQMF